MKGIGGRCMSERIRGIWKDAEIVMAPRALVQAEIDEAFAPVQEWRWADPIERTTALYLEALTAVTTLMHWGWSVTVKQVPTGWHVTASRAFDGQSVKASAMHPRLPDALGNLGEKLQAEMKRSSRPKAAPRRTLEEAA